MSFDGKAYALPYVVEYWGVWYNKETFAKYNLSVPTTWDEFTQLLADIKAAGQTPIAFGSLDGWNAIHEFSVVQHLLVSLDYIRDIHYQCVLERYRQTGAGRSRRRQHGSNNRGFGRERQQP